MQKWAARIQSQDLKSGYIKRDLMSGYRSGQKKKASSNELEASIRSGSDLSSRPVTRQVLSTPKSLTTVFGMGTGVASW